MTDGVAIPSHARRWGGVGIVAAAIALATLRPAPPPSEPLPMFCLVCGDMGGVDVVQNVLLFVPLGAALVLAGISWWRAALYCALASLAIELLQLRVVTGRDSSLSDLVTNSLGGGAGALIVRYHAWLRAPPRAAAYLLALLGAVGMVAALAATGRLLHRSIPAMGLWSQIAPQEHPSFAPFRGTVHHFRVGSTVLAYDFLPQSEFVRRELLDGSGTGRVELTAGELPTGVSAIVRLGSRIHEVYFIGQSHDDLLYRSRLGVRDWLLRLPTVRVSGVLAHAGTRLTVEGTTTDREWRVRVEGDEGTQERVVPFAASLGWSFVLPVDVPLGERYRWISATWLALLVLPCAYWSSIAGAAGAGNRTRRPAAPLLLPLVALAVGVGGIALLEDFASPHWSEWLGGLSGVALGYLLATAAAHRSRSTGARTDATA